MRACARHCKDRRSCTDLTCLGCHTAKRPLAWKVGGWTVPFPQPWILLTRVSCRSRAETKCYHTGAAGTPKAPLEKVPTKVPKDQPHHAWPGNSLLQEDCPATSSRLGTGPQSGGDLTVLLPHVLVHPPP